jgi:hypothetical protein
MLKIFKGALRASSPVSTSLGLLPREYRLRRADGEHRWILDKGIPRYTHEGEFAGYIGSCVERAMGAVRELLRRRKDGSEVPIEIGFNRVHTSRAWHLWPTGNRGGEQTRVLLRKGKTQLESLDINALVNSVLKLIRSD